MARLVSHCELCNHDAYVKSTYQLFDGNEIDISRPWSKLLAYTCGHIVYKPHVATSEEIKSLTYTSVDGTKTSRHYQGEAVQFAATNGFNVMFADQQGLGKTIELLLTLREYQDQLTPCLVVVKSATLWQWQRETKEWLSDLPNAVWVIRNGKDWIPPSFKVYVLSMDTLRSFVKPTDEVYREYSRYGSTSRQVYKVDQKLLLLGIKCLVADEVHSFKNTESKRSQALVEFVRVAGIKHKIFMSGTPIMNRASEYFVPLNMLMPDMFPSMKHFQDYWLTDDGKRIAPYELERFKDLTKDIILRRERNQVLSDLPPFQRVFEDVSVESDTLRKHYNQELDDMRRKDAERGAYRELNYNDIKDNLMRMRKIVGRAKAEMIRDFVNEFMDQAESEKLVIGVHHVEVREYLMAELAAYRPLSLSGEDNSDRKQRLIDAFKRPDRRLMIVNIIAGGTGLNLQFCNNCIVLERQWNAATEEQFEDRFNRIGQELPVTAMYPRLLKTVDEWFSDQVESKRAMFAETVALDYDEWMTNGQVREMVDWIFQQGKL